MTSADTFDYAGACEYIAGLSQLGSRPGLSRISALCDILGNPEDDLSFVHVAGTNGKGSICAMISAGLSAAGMKVGMYYSPALTGIRDHYAIDGKLISEDDYARAVSKVAAANRELKRTTGDGATQFEIETALAFIYFTENHCDVVVLEAGMGGRLDATNVIPNKKLCVIASVSYDHMQYLGDTLSDITKEKAGIITRGCPVVALSSSPEVIDVIKDRCDEMRSPLTVVDPAKITYSEEAEGIKVSCGDLTDLDVSLCGAFQAENAAVAATALSVIGERSLIEGYTVNEKIIRQGLSSVCWPFRFEKINDDPPVFIDGAHNTDAAEKLAKTIKDRLPGYGIILVIGVFRDKEYDKVVKTLAACADKIFTVETPQNARALPAEDLAKCAAKYCSDTTACADIDEAAELAIGAAKASEGKRAVVAAGSLSYLNLFKEACHGDKR